jgi:hypothetical protein
MTNFSLLPTDSGLALKSWPVVRGLIEASLRDTSWTQADSWADGANKPTGSIAYADGRLSADGLKIFLSPRDSANVGSYTIASDTYTAGDAHGMGAQAYGYMVPLLSGSYLLIPDRASNFGILRTDGTFAAGDAHGLTGAGTYYGQGCLALDDVIYIAPGASQSVLTKVSASSGAILGTIAFPVTPTTVQNLCRLLPNGDILIGGGVGSGTSAPFYRFRPSTGLFTAVTLPPSTPLVTNFAAAGKHTLFPDGTLFPGMTQLANWIGYLPSPDTMVYLGNSLSSTSSLAGSVLLQDGRMGVIPASHTAMQWYDRKTRAFTAGATPTSSATTTKFRFPVMTPAGVVICWPQSAAKVGKWTPLSGGTPLPLSVLNSRWFA